MKKVKKELKPKEEPAPAPQPEEVLKDEPEVDEPDLEVEEEVEEEEEVDEPLDYQDLLAQETALRIRTEEDRDNYRDGFLKLKGKKKPLDEDLDDEDDEAPITRKDLAGVVEKVIGRQNVSTILGEISTNPSEQRLILHFYNTTLVHSGNDPVSIRRDLLNAKALANKGTILKKEKEVALALKNKPKKALSPGGGGDEPKIKNGQWSAEQLAYFKKRGLDPNKVQGYLKNPTGARGPSQG